MTSAAKIVAAVNDWLADNQTNAPFLETERYDLELVIEALIAPALPAPEAITVTLSREDAEELRMIVLGENLPLTVGERIFDVLDAALAPGAAADAGDGE